MRVNPDSFFSFALFEKPMRKKKNAFSCGARERCVRICSDKDRSARGKKITEKKKLRRRDREVGTTWLNAVKMR